MFDRSPSPIPAISDAVVEAAARVIVERLTMDIDIDAMVPGDRREVLVCARETISAAIAADREASRAEIERLKAVLDFEKRAARAEIDRLTQDRDSALSSLSLAEQATRTALESIPIAMTAAQEKEREACIEAVRSEHLQEPTTDASDLSYDAAIRDAISAIRSRGEGK